MVEFSKPQIEKQYPFKDVTGTKEDFKVVKAASFLYNILVKTNDTNQQIT